MLLVCPSCATSYEVADTALGAGGRSVRCRRCRTVWFANPPLESLVAQSASTTGETEADGASEEAIAAFKAELTGEPTPPAEEESPVADWDAPVDTDLIPSAEGQDASAPSPDAPASSDADSATAVTEPANDAAGAAHEEISARHAEASPVTISDLPPAEAPPLAPGHPEPDRPPAHSSAAQGPEDIESFAARRAKSAARRRRRLRPGLPMLILMMIGVIAGLIGWRGEVVRHAPQMASLYASIGLPINLRGLVFTDVTTKRDSHDGVAVLVVEGTIVNTTSVQIEVPRLRFAVRNEFGNEIYAWTAQPTQTTVGPGETLPFRSRLASPPTESRAVAVRFFTRRDAVAGVR
jgi:predicted Zn finger-like uncharacterized protein